MGSDPSLSRRTLLAGAGALGALAACQDSVSALDGGADARVDDAFEGEAGEDAAGQDSMTLDGGAIDSADDAGSLPDAEGSDGQLFDTDSDAGRTDAATDPLLTPEADGFDLGVASGDPTPDGAILWAHYEAGRLRLVVWSESPFVEVANRVVSPRDGFFHEQIDGLEPGRWYRYAFFLLSGEGRSPIGRFRTALASDSLEPVLLGGTSCTYNLLPPETLERAGRRTDLDSFLLLGDTTSLEEYLDKWAHNLSKVGWRAIRAATSVIATWDDHEVDNDWDPERLDPTQLDAAREAFFKNLPVRRNPDAPNQIWRKFSFGLTADVFVLDSRSERLPSTRETEKAQYLSRAQLEWLARGLISSEAVFKVIMSSVPIAALPAIWLSPSDRWEGYEAQRRELLELIELTPVSGVVFVSGDLHVAFTGRVAPSGLGSSTLEVLAGPGAQIINPLWRSLEPPQFDFATGDNNYVTLALDPSDRSLIATYRDKDDVLIGERRYVL